MRILRPGRRAGVVAAPLAASTILLAGCAERTPSMFKPDSAGANDIVILAYTIFAILAGVLITVWVLLFTSIVRDRKRPEAEIKQTRGNIRIEIIWTAIPAVIIAALFFLTIRTTGALTVPNAEVRIVATGYQWWWSMEYPEGQFTTANEMHVPVDRGVQLDLRSADVIHSFWVPQMGGKVDMIPGRTNHMTFLPVTEGEYLGECSEFCGHEHGKMRFWLIVESAEEYSAWFANQRKPAARPVGAEAQAGAKLVAGLPCAGCHTIRGTVLRGIAGPDLTHFGSRRSIAAATLTNTPEELRRWLHDPQEVKPESLMPTIPLGETQLDQLVAYLEGLK